MAMEEKKAFEAREGDPTSADRRASVSLLKEKWLSQSFALPFR
jgi:hypothetical protein